MWLRIVSHIPKEQRYTLGARIENKFLNLLEVAYQAYFIEREKKVEKVTHCVLLLDTLKFLLHVAWEAKLISHKHYAEIAEKLDEIGKMLGGWRKNLDNPEKKNRTL